jgi:NAD(P)-dependent dehydrogenase (short-subunit alcohol dehydrogenase family)
MSVKQLFDLTGKVALVTGGSRGLGLQMAEALGEMGGGWPSRRARPTNWRRRSAPRTAGHRGAHGGERPVEVRPDPPPRRSGARTLRPDRHPGEQCRRHLGCADRGLPGRRLDEGHQPQCQQHVLPDPRSRQTIAYNASKGADVNFVRALAAEWGRYNINVNAICPGFFPSKMANGLLEKFGEQVVAHTPLGRLGGEEDLKGAVVYLASEASRHVTGHALVVDGGSTSY